MRSWLFLVLASVLVACPCRAESSDPAAAEALFRAGREATEHGDPETACTRFEESYRLDPAPGTLLNIATCEEALKRLAQAWQHYRRLLDEMEPNDLRRATVRERLAALEPRVPKLTITGKAGAPEDQVVRRDGVLVNRGGFGVPLPLDPGDHVLVVSATGHLSRKYTLSLIEGETRSVEVEAGPPVAPEQSPAEIPPEPREPAQADPLRGVAFVSLGAATASGMATGILVWRYLVARGVVDEKCNAALKCDDEGLRAAGAASVLGTASLVAGAATAVSLGVGLTLLWTHPSGAPSEVTAIPSGVVWSGVF